MSPLSIRGKRNYISLASFILIFGALIIVATFYDLKISKILTRFSLKSGDYYTRDVFANFFEAAGMLPKYFMAAFASISIGWYVWKSFLNKYLRLILFLCAIGVAVYLLSGGFRDLLFYPLRHAFAEDVSAAKNTLSAMTPTIYLISYVFSAGCIGLALFCTRNVPAKIWNRLAYFAIAYFLLALLSKTIVSFLKGYVDRVRFRAMNSTYGQSVGGFDLYTRWYEVTNHADILRTTPLVDYTDSFYSFPSGHTQNAAFSYGLIMLIDCLEIKNKRIRLALWVAPILWTGLTAIGRIVAGAHFMSDVLFGGTIPFVLMIIIREIYICHFKNIKAMFPFTKKSKREA